MSASVVDPICGMTGVFERYGRWFCGEPCAKRYADQLARSMPTGLGRRLRDPWVWVPVTAIVIATVDLWWPSAGPVAATYRGYLHVVLLPLLVGIALGGLIDYAVPKQYVIQLLSGARRGVILRSVLLGFLASTCSHGCLALSVELYRKGASIPAVVSFLLASPWASMALTFLLLSLFGMPGLILVAASLLIAGTTGLIFQQLDRRGLLETNPHHEAAQPQLSIARDVASRLRTHSWTARQVRQDLRAIARGMVPLGRMTLGWVQLGLLLGAGLGAWMPHHLMQHYFGATLGGLVLTLGAAAVIEVCSEGTAPLAFELYRHTGALGNAFAFLMGGVVTDYSELAVLWTVIGRRTVGWLLAITLPLVLFTGLLLNLWMRYNGQA